MTESGLDHLVYATPDLDDAVDALSKLLGTTIEPGGSHPGWGTHNALFSLGAGTYFEIIGPDPQQPDPPGPRPFAIDHLEEGRLVTWAFRHPDPESARELLIDLDIRLGPVRSKSRTRPDGTSLSWKLTEPEPLVEGGVIPFLIDWGSTPHPSSLTSSLTSSLMPSSCSLVRLAGRHPDPDRLRPALDALGADVSVSVAPAPGLTALLRTPRGEIELT